MLLSGLTSYSLIWKCERESGWGIDTQPKNNSCCVFYSYHYMLVGKLNLAKISVMISPVLQISFLRVNFCLRCFRNYVCWGPLELVDYLAAHTGNLSLKAIGLLQETKIVLHYWCLQVFMRGKHTHKYARTHAHPHSHIYIYRFAIYFEIIWYSKCKYIYDLDGFEF